VHTFSHRPDVFVESLVDRLPACKEVRGTPSAAARAAASRSIKAFTVFLT
jgi:hypothetical protein